MRKILSLITTITALILLIVSTTFAQEASALRFVHAVPGVTAIDVYIDGELSVTGLGYGEASSYVEVTDGTYAVTVRPEGLGTDLWTQSVDAIASIPKTLIASNPAEPTFDEYEDDFAATELGITRFRAIHAIADAPNVDITAQGQTLVSNLTYSDFVGGFDIPADTYPIAVFPTGEEDPILPETNIGLSAGTSQIILVYGTPGAPELTVLTAPLAGGDDAGFVRLAHGILDAPAVDVYAGETLIAPNLIFSEATEHLALPAGDYTIAVNTQGTDETLFEADLTVEANTAVTAIAQTGADGPEIGVYADEVSAIDTETAVVTLINTISGESSVTATLADGTVLGEDIAFGTAGDVVTLDPTQGELEVTFMIDGESATLTQDPVTLYGGIYYNAIAVDGSTFSPPAVLFFPTTITYEPGNAPGADETLVVELPPTGEPAVEAVTPEEGEVPAETTAEAQEAETEETPVEVAQPTQAAPTAAPQPTNPPPVPTEEQLPTARLLIDPGANLNLREYPSADARVLGQAPSNATLIVNGREGDLLPNDDGSVTIPLPLIDTFGQEDFEYVDPVELLESDNADLDPEDTWIYVTYPTPDGGQINAWVLSLYTSIFNADGEQQPLRDLETIPANQEGNTLDTDVTPPPPQEDVVTGRVVGIEIGRNLNIRRTADVTSEVVGVIPSDSVAEIRGFGPAREWAFISYRPAEGGTFTGWVSTQFLTYLLNGNPITLEELEAMNMLVELDPEETRGEVSADAPLPSTNVTPDPVQDAYVGTVVGLNEDTNLNLRRDPTIRAEVLGRIPLDTQLIIDGRTGDGDWLLTTFEDASGWIAVDFVALTFNGAVASVDDLPVVEGFEEGFENAEATEEPENTETEATPTEEDAEATEETNG